MITYNWIEFVPLFVYKIGSMNLGGWADGGFTFIPISVRAHGTDVISLFKTLSINPPPFGQEK